MFNNGGGTDKNWGFLVFLIALIYFFISFLISAVKYIFLPLLSKLDRL
jgi:hypothetical protein